MEPRSRNEPRSFSFPVQEDWRSPSNLKTMSISELFSELRDTFMRRDFDLVEETLIAREEMLKEEIEKKKRELELSEERTKFEQLERRTVEFKLERIQEEMNKKVLMKNVNERSEMNKKVLMKNVNERSDVVAMKNHLVSDGVTSPVAEMRMNEEVLMESGTGNAGKWGREFERGDVVVGKNRLVGDDDGVDSADGEMASENVGVLVKEKKGGDEQPKKDRPSASDTEWQSSSGAVQKNLDARLAKPTALPTGDAMRKAAIAERIMLLQKKNQFKSSGRLNFDGEGVTVNGASSAAKLKGPKVEVLAKTKRLAGEPSKKDDLGSSGKKQQNSSGAVQENLATKLVESIGIKRDFPLANMDIWDALDSSDSSSSSSGSSSSDEIDMVISNKKMRTNASQSTNGLD